MDEDKRKCRWIPIKRTTPSGKSQFVCSICGRTSIAPDKDCPVWEDLTFGPMSCKELEEGVVGGEGKS